MTLAPRAGRKCKYIALGRLDATALSCRAYRPIDLVLDVLINNVVGSLC
jgi:hypothetical protein